jgi:hypothetical protein
MPIKTLLAALVALAALFAAQSATASQPHRYTLHGKHKHCRKGYRRVKKTRKTFCIMRAKKKRRTPLAEKVKLHAHLDPTYTRDPLDPFKITYAYSASATQDAVARTSAATKSSVEEPASLPSGVLALYSDGQLECAVNVGSGVEGSECPVHYQALGEHRVTTIYTSGEQSATETEVEHIEPLPTTLNLSVSYAPLPEAQEVSGTQWWWIGNLSVSPSVHPQTAEVRMSCGEEPTETYGSITPGHCYMLGPGEAHVYGWFNCSEELASSVRISYERPRSIDPVVEWPTGQEILEGALHLRAQSGGIGYIANSATVPIAFSPTKLPTC